MKVLAVFLALALVLTAGAQALPGELARAVQPLQEGVPQVAVVRLRALLAAGKLPEDERRAATVKLGEALVAAGEPQAALEVLADPLVQASAEAKFPSRAGFRRARALGRGAPAFRHQRHRSDPPLAKRCAHGPGGSVARARPLG